MNLEYFDFDPTQLPTYTDWRLPENRIEAFSRVTHVRSVEGDLDHHHVGKVIADMSGWDNDQKALYCMYFGQSYRNHWAMIAMQLDLYNMSEDQLIDWHNKNWRRMKFGNDTKWNVRKFPQFVMDIKKKVGKGSLYEYLGNAASGGATEQNYWKLNNTLQEFYSIGRMTAWLAQQTLYEFFDWDIDHWDQQLFDNATWSQYDSICYLFNRIDIARKQKIVDQYGNLIEIKSYEPNKQDIAVMEQNTQILMEEVNKRIPFHVDIYNVESVECEYRKTAYGPKIKEFTFWTTNELVEDYEYLRSLWADYDGPGKLDWSPYVAGFMTKGRNVTDFGYHRDYFKVVTDFGMNLNTHHLYKDEPNAHAVLNLPKNVSSSVLLMKDHWQQMFTEEHREVLIDKYNPVRFLKFKDKSHPAWKDPNVDFSYYHALHSRSSQV
jgi:hypothetical protein